MHEHYCDGPGGDRCDAGGIGAARSGSGMDSGRSASADGSETAGEGKSRGDEPALEAGGYASRDVVVGGKNNYDQAVGNGHAFAGNVEVKPPFISLRQIFHLLSGVMRQRVYLEIFQCDP